MRSLNEHKIVGNVGKDPYYKPGHGNGSFIAFSVATTVNWKDKNDEWQSNTQWHDVKAFGKMADKLSSTVHKGTPVFVSGSHEYEKREKDGKEYNYSFIRATEIYVIAREEKEEGAETGRRSGGGARRRKPADEGPTAPPADDDFYAVGGGDDDIPF